MRKASLNASQKAVIAQLETAFGAAFSADLVFVVTTSGSFGAMTLRAMPSKDYGKDRNDEEKLKGRSVVVETMHLIETVLG